MTALQIIDFTLHLNGSEKKIFENLNVKADFGEILIIAGPIGCGKSSLLRAIAKQFYPNTIKYASGDIITTNMVTVVYQRPKSQIITFQVDEELATKMSFTKKPRVERRNKVKELSDVYNLSSFLQRDPRSLSSGEQQKIVIISTISNLDSRQIILLDEPLSMLDNENKRIILNLFKKLLDEGHLLVIADPFVDYYADFQPILLEITQTQSTPDPYKHKKIKENLMDLQITESNFEITGSIGYDKLITKVDQIFNPDKINLILGKNGSGKTALLKTLAGLIEPFSGTVDFPSVVGYIPQDTLPFFYRKTVRDELSEFEEYPNWVIDILNRSPFLISEGQRKKLAIEICLAIFNIILLDEPSQGLDKEELQWLIDVVNNTKSKMFVIASNDDLLINQINENAQIIELR